jgi:simple sugar transport system ATP-binding protein
LAREEGKTLVLVSHKLDEVQELCDHAYVLRKGKLVGESPIPCDNQTLIQMMFERLPPRSERPSLVKVETIFEGQAVSIRTHRMQVEDVTLHLNAGETLGFAGLEGSGQSLILRAIAGLEKTDDGRIWIDNLDVTSMSYHQRVAHGVAYMPAGRLEEGLVHDLTLTEHMVLSAPEQSFFIDWQAASTSTAERIERFQVVGTQASTADALSGGNQQRFLFAMLNSPLRVILLDQPTRGLDVRSTHWMWNELDHWREQGTGIIFISTDLDEIVERSDRIAVFSGGRLIRVVNAAETNEGELGHLIGGSVA